MKVKSISARISEKAAKELDFLIEELNLSKTAIFEMVIKKLYAEEQKKKAQLSPFDIFEELDLIGCLESDPNLSENYKSEITDSLIKKHS